MLFFKAVALILARRRQSLRRAGERILGKEVNDRKADNKYYYACYFDFFAHSLFVKSKLYG
jgi:hypothetical protein